MRRKWAWLAFPFVVVVGTALFYTGAVMGTPAVGFVGQTIALGRFGNIDVFNHAIVPDSDNDDSSSNFGKRLLHRRKDDDVWLSWQKTRGQSDVYVQSNVWQPGGSTGWHTHPGHSLIIVTQGAITAYEGNDPTCTPTVYTQGMGFVDPGGDHVHNLRNEGSVEAQTIAVQVIPAGAMRRIDADNPGNCPF